MYSWIIISASTPTLPAEAEPNRMTKRKPSRLSLDSDAMKNGPDDLFESRQSKKENGWNFNHGKNADFFVVGFGRAPLRRVARFFSVQSTKTRENIPNKRKMHQMAIKFTNWP
jgi:hypothetical protein